MSAANGGGGAHLSVGEPGERGCLTPSLIAKSLLAWLIYPNVLRT
jgi:hypothetical protein